MPAWDVGHPASFGVHSLLGPQDLNVLWRVLQCQKCHLRQLYHHLASSEFQKANLSSIHMTRASNTSALRRRSIFVHNISRLIKAVLMGYDIQRKHPPVLQAKITFSTLDGAVPGHQNSGLCTVASISSRRRLLVCVYHGRELFEWLYQCGPSGEAPSSASSAVIPAGQSEFVRSLERNTTQHKQSASEKVRCSVRATIINFTGVELDIKSLPKCRTSTKCANRPSNPLSCGKFRLADNTPSTVEVDQANARWSSFYGDPHIDSHHDTNCSRVHFPPSNPVTSVHTLITYATACQLERGDRAWEISARRRSFSKYCEYVSKGLNCEEAAQRAELDESSDEETVEKITPLPTTCASNSVALPAVYNKFNCSKSREEHQHIQQQQISSRLLFAPSTCDVLSQENRNSCSVTFSGIDKTCPQAYVTYLSY